MPNTAVECGPNHAGRFICLVVVFTRFAEWAFVEVQAHSFMCEGERFGIGHWFGSFLGFRLLGSSRRLELVECWGG